ncbi:hypothetical protein E3N88_10211 [Mikania micrantha]|uniref:Integrase catalytic domain-containing protein n=1 Tax=Mikania micrantha TaxID=192012 RepID=A0A5N6PA07_9ASTR|nr:hypothetical protein E3N88_10211 [Mikania micrantha]
MSEETVSYQSVPRFDGDYEHWSMVMENLLRLKEFWIVVKDGVREPQDGEILTEAQKSVLETMRLKDLKARNYLFQSIDRQIMRTITQKESAKMIWDAMKTKYQGNPRVKRAHLQRLRREFELLEMKDSESVTDYLNRVMATANDMRAYGDDLTDVKIVEKVLRSLTDNFNYVVCTIEESRDVDLMSIDELQSSLLVHEQKILKKPAENQVLKVEQDFGSSRGRGRGRGQFGRGRGRGRGRTRGDFDKSHIECYNCHTMGHFAYECPNERKAQYAEFDDGEELLLMAQTADDDEEVLLMTHTNEPKQEAETKGFWFIDSGCSNHMTGSKDWFIRLDETYKHSVKLGNDLKLLVQGLGDIKLTVEGVTQTITKVYYVPDLTSNLLSVGQLQEKDLTIVIKHNMCKAYHAQRGLLFTSLMTKNRMFVIQGSMKTATDRCLEVKADADSLIWHRRFGHISFKYLRTMQQNELVLGLPKVGEYNKVCDTCLMGKQQKEAIPKRSTWRASEKLQLIHTDLCGPISPTSPSGKRYILSFIDDFSRKGWLYFLSNKSESFEYFQRFKALVENETNKTIKALRSDRGGEFISNEFNAFCDKHGIKRQLTTAFTPQQNGVAERRNKTIMNMVRCVLIDKSLPKWLWSEAANWAGHLINRTYTSALENKVPEEVWAGKKPHVEHFKVFGSIAFAQVPAQMRTKLDDRSKKCIFLGISLESKAYRLYDPVSRKVMISRDVVFDEDNKWSWSKEELGSSVLSIPDEYVDVVDSDMSGIASENGPEEGTHTSSSSNTNAEAPMMTGAAIQSQGDVASSSHTAVNQIVEATDSQVTRRIVKAPVWLNDYQTGVMVAGF